MKWNKIFIAVTNDKGADGLIHALKTRYNIPDDRCFNFSDGSLVGTTKAWPGCLNSIDLSSKLFLLSHSNEYTFSVSGASYSPTALAEFLNRYGLREAGLISFKSCEIGARNFLNSFLAGLTSHGVKVGWLKGYKERFACLDLRDGSHLLLSNTELLEAFSTNRIPNMDLLHLTGEYYL